MCGQSFNMLLIVVVIVIAWIEILYVIVVFNVAEENE